MFDRNVMKCYLCGNDMETITTTKTIRFQGKTLEIKGIETHQCSCCGEKVLATQEVKMIENIVQALNGIEVPKIEVLNLEETARYLRVSNQTIYNMIRDGRIKAHKVGREWRFFHSDILSYINGSSSYESLRMAAKGGDVSENDFRIIQETLEEEDD